MEHDDLIRCPGCRHCFEPSPDDELYGEQDGASVNCPKCDREFQVNVHISISYESPALDPVEPKEE